MGGPGVTELELLQFRPFRKIMFFNFRNYYLRSQYVTSDKTISFLGFGNFHHRYCIWIILSIYLKT